MLGVFPHQKQSKKNNRREVFREYRIIHHNKLTIVIIIIIFENKIHTCKSINYVAKYVKCGCLNEKFNFNIFQNYSIIYWYNAI